MNTLYETDKLILENKFETTYIKDKSTGKILFEQEFYGEIECGLIDKNDQWVVLGGEYLSIWTPTTFQTFDNIKWIHSLRMKDNNTIEILTDPWCDTSAIWEVNLNSFKSIKIKEFLDYKQQEYTDKINW